MKTEIGTRSLNLKHKIRFSDDPSAPLVYLIHGRAGNYDVMWTFAGLIPAGWNVIAPQAYVTDPVPPLFPDGLSWWAADSEVKFPQRADPAAQKLKEFISGAEAGYALQPSVRIAFGFSQGAALLSYLVQTEPLLFSKVAMLAGFVIRASQPPEEVATRIFMAHGSKDEVVPVSQSQQGLEFLRERGFSVDYHLDEVGHKAGSGALRELKKWLTEV